MHNPPHPGEFIRATNLEPFELSIRSLAESLGVSPSTLARVVNESSGISPEMALRLSKALGRSPGSWLAMQHACDLFEAKRVADLSHVRKLEFDVAQPVTAADA
jgi:addiction module HigA family antidote